MVMRRVAHLAERHAAVGRRSAHARQRLLGTGNPIGANGLAIVDRTEYVGVTEQAYILAVPINRDGSAGQVGIFAADGALFAMDGMAAAADGSIFASIIGQFSIVRVLTDGTVVPVASAAAGDEGVLDVSRSPAAWGRRSGPEHPAASPCQPGNRSSLA